MITKDRPKIPFIRGKIKDEDDVYWEPIEPENPSRIISIGFYESLAYSWEKVDRLHMSDPGQNSWKDQISFFSGLYSRLSNTEDDIKIEGVAGIELIIFGNCAEICSQTSLQMTMKTKRIY